MSYYVQDYTTGRGGKWWNIARVYTLEHAREWAKSIGHRARIITIHNGKKLIVPRHADDYRKHGD